MEVQEQAKGSKHSFKGKRTKRQRTMSPFPLNMATTSSCSSGEAMIGSGGVFGDSSPYSGGFDRVTPSPSNNSGELAQSSVEEEDMANCLILLAQGQTQKPSAPPASAAAVAVTSSKSTADQDVYQCKTCDRCFPSFQALGGHRASHKKPKPVLEDHKNNAFLLGHQETSVRLIKDEDTNTTLSLQIPSGGDNSRSPNNNKSRVHECSICGAEFTSGQALGGHMRRHRPLPVVARTSSNDEGSQEAVKKPRTLLALDLNLPAPDHEPEEDILLESKYPFASTEQVIVFSASHPLVDCHY